MPMMLMHILIEHSSNYSKTSECLSDCNWTRTHNHLAHKQTLNHLAKTAK